MDRRVLAAMRLMERQMEHELAIAPLAASFGLTLHHFHRLFVEETGEPPAAFLRRIRVDAAALRLKWADEPTETLAHAVGFRSRAAFSRAFQKQFGMPPASYRRQHRGASEASALLKGRRLTLREVGSFHLVGRRYIGDIGRMVAYWTDLFERLPPELTVPGRALYVGQLHDDYRVTDPDKVRYDCAVTIDAAHADDDGAIAARGLELIRSEAGRYVTVEHRGHHTDIPATYDFACHEWVIPRGLVPGSNPAIELHTVPRHLQARDDVSFTLLFPVE